MFRWVGGAPTPDPLFVRRVPGAVRVVVDRETLERVCVTEFGCGLAVGRLVTVGLVVVLVLPWREPTLEPAGFRFLTDGAGRPVSIPRGD